MEIHHLMTHIIGNNLFQKQKLDFSYIKKFHLIFQRQFGGWTKPNIKQY
jgi:hypothetical protein